MRKTFSLAISLLLIITSLSSASANTPRAGGSCKKVGATVISKGREFTCIKRANKRVWNRGVAIRAASQNSPTPVASPSASPTVLPTPAISPSPSAISSPSASPSASPSVSPSVIPTPAASPTRSPASTVREFTRAEVAARNTAADCWSIINDNVYDLTPWINSHPGGPSAIRGLCGIDGTVRFGNMHGNESGPMRELNRYLLGKLKS